MQVHIRAQWLSSRTRRQSILVAASGGSWTARTIAFDMKPLVRCRCAWAIPYYDYDDCYITTIITTSITIVTVITTTINSYYITIVPYYFTLSFINNYQDKLPGSLLGSLAWQDLHQYGNIVVINIQLITIVKTVEVVVIIMI